jgi:3-deoxy-D-manno-octulosonic-acid transferase
MLYNTAILLYDLIVHIATLFNRKARLMVRGHWAVYNHLKKNIDPNAEYLWFHAASLGEFEQGRPLIEAIRERHPQYKILLTFFSPSGYEVRKNYAGADIVCYIPFDIKHLAKRFINIANPKMAFFIKYEFWRNFLDELHRRGVPTYSVSSIFRPEQIFFKWYGGNYRSVLGDFDRLFVQNESSRKLLKSIGVENVDVVGDTRFDRVITIRDAAKPVAIAETFKNGSRVLVAGSTWDPDEEYLISMFNARPDLKLIIAPHVISEDHIERIVAKLKRPYVRYSQVNEHDLMNKDCLIIDNYGMLSSIYRYGEIAYIGGGFGVGIHNTLEAAVYGVPVIFGPNHKRFQEAMALKEQGGAFAINNGDDLNNIMDRLLTDDEFLKSSGVKAGAYVTDNAGASEKVLKYIGL